LTSLAEKKVAMPIITDYVNRAYFRSWRDGEIHMHQPRKKAVQETSTAFAENPLAVLGADFINDPSNQAIGYSQNRIYEDIAKQRFDNIKQTIYSSGHRSFFDITPDLRFILGPDTKIPNLIHCLESGQAFKYAPAFGEMMSEFVFDEGPLSKLGGDFSIDRFNSDFMENFWKRVSGGDYNLETDGASL
jgi:glycine/D-amino acid oxidase-like deaminating enzyme